MVPWMGGKLLSAIMVFFRLAFGCSTFWPPLRPVMAGFETDWLTLRCLRFVAYYGITDPKTKKWYWIFHYYNFCIFHHVNIVFEPVMPKKSCGNCFLMM
jgi:hypothetical protein